MQLALTRMVCVLSLLLFTCSGVLGAGVHALHGWINGENIEGVPGRANGIYAGLFTHLSARDQNNDSIGWCIASKTPGKNIRIVARNPFRKYARIRACRYHDCVRYAPVKMPSRWKTMSGIFVRDYPDGNTRFARSDTSGDPKQIEMSDCDDEDDDIVSIKKQADCSNSLVLLLNTPAAVYFLRTVKGTLPFCNYLASSASDKCIVLRVMRI